MNLNYTKCPLCRDPQTKIAIALWGLFIVAICLIVWSQGMNRTVTPSYMLGANLWMTAQDLYDHSGRGFIYLPQAAVLYIPFAWLAKYSFSAAEMVWRIISLSGLAFALYRVAACFQGKAGVAGKGDAAKTFFNLFLLLTLITIPLAFSSARNGQFNIILEVLMLLAAVALSSQQWWRATFYLALGLALKPTIIVFLLLVWVLYRQLWWRMVIGILLVLLFPFLTLHAPHYVIAQYVNSITMLKEAAVVGAVHAEWAQLFGLLSALKIHLAGGWQDLCRIVAAIFTLYCSWRAQKNYGYSQGAIFIYMLAACYLMLFNPRTENNDYVIVAPAIGLCLHYLCLEKIIPKLGLALLVGIFILIILANNFWLAPLATLLLFVILLCNLAKYKLE